jgi:hypothetical protein
VGEHMDHILKQVMEIFCITGIVVERVFYAKLTNMLQKAPLDHSRSYTTLRQGRMGYVRS